MARIINKPEETPKRQQLRNEAPPAECLLWKHLRKEALGVKFRRQVSFDGYVVDFYCPQLKLALEIDGESHASDESQLYDAQRQAEIEVVGVRFLRFSNQDVYRYTTNVVEIIFGVVNKMLSEKQLEIAEQEQAKP